MIHEQRDPDQRVLQALLQLLHRLCDQDQDHREQPREEPFGVGAADVAEYESYPEPRPEDRLPPKEVSTGAKSDEGQEQ